MYRAELQKLSLTGCLVHFPVPALQHVERLLLLATIGDQAFAVPVVLDARQRAAGGAEVGQDPGGGAAEEGDFFEHSDLVLIDALLVLLGPARKRITVMVE